MGMAATSAYVAATQNLDLNQVQLVIVALPEVRARLYDRTMTLFMKADLPLLVVNDSHAPATATLTLDPIRSMLPFQAKSCIGQFMTDYNVGNPVRQSQGTRPNPKRPQADHEPRNKEPDPRGGE